MSSASWASWIRSRSLQRVLYNILLYAFIPFLMVMAFFSMSQIEATLPRTTPVNPNLTVLQAVEGRSVYQISKAHERVTFTIFISHAMAAMRSAENLVVSMPLPSEMQFVEGSVKIAVDHHSPVSDSSANPTVGIALQKHLPEGVLHSSQTVRIDFLVDVTFPTKLDAPSDTWRRTTSSSVAYTYTNAPKSATPFPILSNKSVIVFPPKASLYPTVCPLYPMIEPTHPAIKVITTIQKDPGGGKREEGSSDAIAVSLGDDVLCLATIQPTYLLPFDALVFQDLLAPGLIYDQSRGIRVSQIKEWGTNKQIEQVLYQVDPVAGFLIPLSFLSGFSIGKPITVAFYAKVNSPSPFSDHVMYHRSLVRNLRSKQDEITDVCKEMIDPPETVASNETMLTILPADQDPLLVMEKRVNNVYRAYLKPGKSAFFTTLLTNYGGDPIMEAAIVESLPSGFNLIKGSFQVNGVKKTPQWSPSSSLLTFSPLPPICKEHPITVSFWAKADFSLDAREHFPSVAEAIYKKGKAEDITVPSNFVTLIVGPSKMSSQINGQAFGEP